MRIARTSPLKFGLLCGLLAAALLLVPKLCLAHPMGNFSISHYARIAIDRDSVEVLYTIDMAEIPAFQAMRQSGISGMLDDARLPAFLRAQAMELGEGIHLSLNGRSVLFDPVSQSVLFPPGAGGLPTMKLSLVYRSAFPQACTTQSCKLSYEDTNFAGRVGWKEIVLHADHRLNIQSSTVSDRDRSAMLTNYPADLINGAPQQLQAEVVFAVVAPIVGTAPRREAQLSRVPHSELHEACGGAIHGTASPQATPSPSSETKPEIVIAANTHKTPRSAMTELIATRKLSFGMVLFAILVAAGLGALHALEPGHGKTIVAAYLVGTRGTAKDALLLGTVVTITHTAGVYLLGAITLYAQRYIFPDKLYPILGVLSGIMIAGMGLYLALQRLAGVELIHSHANGEIAHRHIGILHSHQTAKGAAEAYKTDECSAADGKAPPLYELLVLGITGGIVPCPAALVVLLSALALHRVSFGLFLIVSFSAGLAVVLISMGLVAVYAGRWILQGRTEGPFLQRWLPLTSAAMMTLLGCAITAQSLMTAGLLRLHA